MCVQTLCGCGQRTVSTVCARLLQRRTCIPVSHTLCRLIRTPGKPAPYFHVSRHVASVIYTDPYDTGNVAVLEIDLDLQSRFRDIKKLHKNVTLRKLDSINVYHLAMKHKTLCEVARKKQQLEERREEISREMNHLIKQEQTEARRYIQGKLKKEGKELRDDIKNVTRYYVELERDVLSLGLELPVDLRDDTPELDDRIERTDSGTVSSDSYSEQKNHVTIGEQNGTIVKRNVGLMRYYLVGDLASKEQDILNTASERLTDDGFIQMSCPNIVKTLPVEASGSCIEMPDKVYILKDKDIAGSDHAERTWNRTRYLSGVSPHGFIAFMTKMNFQESSLPLKYFSVGKNYSPSRAVRDLGLFTTAEATVVELFGVAQDVQQVAALYSHFQDVMWDLCRQLCPQLPKRLVAKEPKALALTEAGRVDLEVWSPYLKEYIVVGSVASWSDFVARRVLSKWSPNVDKVLPSNHVHTVHGTAFNVTALLGLLLEADDGHLNTEPDQ